MRQPTLEALHASPRRHAPLTIALHWGSALLVVAAFALILFREDAEGRALRATLLAAHRWVGLGLLLLTGLRLTSRLRGPQARASNIRPLARFAAAGAHATLYAGLIALPLLGWALSNAHGAALRPFDLFPLPTLCAPDADLADRLEDTHRVLAWTLAGLVALHALAALWHHLVLRDGVLHGMLPRLRPPSRP